MHIITRKPIKIFIGNVPHEATSKDLRTVFEESGLDIHKCDKVGHGVENEHVDAETFRMFRGCYCKTTFHCSYSGGGKRHWLCSCLLQQGLQGDQQVAWS